MSRLSTFFGSIMIVKRLVTVLAAVGLFGLPVVALTASPAYAAEFATQVLVGSDQRQLYGKRVRVAARLEYQSGTWQRVVGEQLQLERRLPGKSYVVVDTKTTGADDAATTDYDETGEVLFKTKAVSNATYRVVYRGGVLGGDPEQALNASQSGAKSVKVLRNVGGKAKNLGKGKFRFSGKVRPDYGKRRIILQRLQGKKWKRIGSQVTSRRGAWSFVVFAKRTPGKVSYRTLALRDKRFVESPSRIVLELTTIPG